jgi:Double-GTPase 2
MNGNEIRKCPYCTRSFRLGDCRVISAVSSSPFGDFHHDDNDDNDDVDDVESTSDSFKVLAEPPNRSGRKLFNEPKGVHRPDREWSPELIPRRQCPHPDCKSPLPLEIDECNVIELAVIGLNRAGKTYWIGSALTRATRTDDLAAFGIERVTPLDKTAETLHSQYYLPLFRKEEHSLELTKEDHHLNEPPLMFEVKLAGSRPVILVVRDVSGEVLVAQQSRLRKASFLNSADAVAFMVDPRDMFQVADDLPDPEDAVEERNINQVALLEAVLRENTQRRPLAIVVSKGDLLEELRPDVTPLGQPAGSDMASSLSEHSDLTRRMLLALGERRLVSLADSAPPVSYHVVSVLGRRRVRIARGGRPASIGILQPLAVLLNRVCRNLG